MKLNVFFIDCTQGYGYSFSACNTKIEFMAKGLNEIEADCYIHNGLIGNKRFNKTTYYTKKDIGTVINYPMMYNKLISPFFNFFRLISDLKRFKINNAKNIVILEAPYLPYYYLEILAARIFNFKIVVISHEWLATFQSGNFIRRKICHLYSKVFGYSADGILPISEYIINKIQKFKKPYLKVPIEADFSLLPKYINNDFFLYCVSAEYYRVIKMVIDGFIEFKNNKIGNEYKLFLVLSGNETAIKKIYEYIELSNMKGSIIIKQKLPYKDLLYLYSTASGLIVALDPNNIQDRARFSQKIAEYLSSGTPILTNNVGEIKYYFTDKKNIIINEYSSKGFYNSFTWIAENPTLSQKVGEEGFYLGKEYFDYRICAKQLYNFLQSL